MPKIQVAEKILSAFHSHIKFQPAFLLHAVNLSHYSDSTVDVRVHSIHAWYGTMLGCAVPSRLASTWQLSQLEAMCVSTATY